MLTIFARRHSCLPSTSARSEGAARVAPPAGQATPADGRGSRPAVIRHSPLSPTCSGWR